MLAIWHGRIGKLGRTVQKSCTDVSPSKICGTSRKGTARGWYGAPTVQTVLAASYSTSQQRSTKLIQLWFRACWSSIKVVSQNASNCQYLKIFARTCHKIENMLKLAVIKLFGSHPDWLVDRPFAFSILLFIYFCLEFFEFKMFKCHQSLWGGFDKNSSWNKQLGP